MDKSKISITVEGVNLPNKPLTNFQFIIDTVKELKIPHFRGVFMRNDLPRRPLKRECGILNLDGVLVGEHIGFVGIKIMITFTSIALRFNLLTN